MKFTFRVEVSVRKRETKFRLQRHAISTPSWAISSVSIATSFPVALKLAPVHFVGQPLLKFQRSFSSPASLIRMIEPFFRSVLLSIDCLRHFQSEASSVIPHFIDMLLYF